MNLPVMICGFKRPDNLQRVLDAAKAAGINKLYLVLDAPRRGRTDDEVGYVECRKLFDAIDWPCEVHRNYAGENMGCGARMTSGMDWVFAHEDRAVILEDDCVPDPSFFRFCDELLERYELDDRVGMIAGHDEHRHMDKINLNGGSYYFDRMSCVWGWATWRRCWLKHDSQLKRLDELIASGKMINVLKTKRRERLWRANILNIKSGKKRTWAGAWATTMYREGWLSIHPAVNLVANIGIGGSSREDAQKTGRARRLYASRPVTPMSFPLKHPSVFIPDELSEESFMSDILYAPKWMKMILDPWICWDRIVKAINRFLNRS